MTQRNLDFAIALAPDWQQIDLLAPDADGLVDATLAAALARGAQGGPHARLLMTRSLYAVTPTGEPLAAGLSVALADREAPVSSAPLEADDFDGAAVAAITLPVGSGLRVRRIALDTTLDGIEIPVLRVQYLIHTGPGLLTITLTTFQAAQTEEWERLFDAIAQTAELA
jgi:hypothetical protein